MEQLIESLKNFGVVRLAVVSALIIGMGSGMHYLTSRLGEPELALLYANLDLADASKIVSKLESTGVPAEIRGGGTEVYVPASRVARIRMEMAEAGLPRGGTIGYEIFDKTDTLGTSGFVQDINHVRALEGEIARTIATLAQVESARVHLVLPRRELFSRDRQTPSASIMLRLQGPGKLQQSRVQAIQHLVASAVPGLAPEGVSIVDDKGNLLARGDNNADILSAANLEEMRLAQENRLSQTIESLLEKHVGAGKVRAEVSMQMDMDRTTENSEEYNPDGQVVRSQQTVDEGENSTEGGSGAASVANNQPGATAGGASGGKSASNRKEETINYEISKKIKTFVKETGTIKKLSVAVMVDGVYKGEGAEKDKKYEARTPDEMKQLKTLVENAIGFNAERGDKVEVINMQFAPITADAPEENASSFFSFTHPDIVRLIESAIVGVMGLLMLLMVVKPLLVRLLESMAGQKENLVPAYAGDALPAPSAAGLVQAALQAQPSVSAPANQANVVAALPQNQDALAIEKMVNLQQIEGQVRESTLKTVSQIIDGKPEEAVSVVRGWMQEK